MTNLLTIKEVSTLMGFKSPGTVDRLVKEGKMKAIRVGRGRKIPDWEYERYVVETVENENRKEGEGS